MRVIRQLVFTLLAVAIGASASAAPFVVGTTSNAGRWVSDSVYSSLRGALLDPQRFGPGGVVDRPVQFAAPGGPITGQYLAGVDTFFLNEPYEALSTAEIDALKAFVLSGRSLLMVSESEGNAAIDAVLQALDGSSIGGFHGTTGSDVYALGGSSALLAGPFGNLAGQALGGSPGAGITLGSRSTAVATYGSHVLVSEMAPGALAPNSGRVLVLGDVLFMNYFWPGGGIAPDPDNAILALNYFAAAANTSPSTDPGHDVPEPVTVLLLGVAGLAAARRARHAR
ncbi:hypothetical protein TBR22_A48520 [Luteitalea sp. TBR-22]|uniref:PEP-CTERM sorting domain-containing protein n=1 Tax=Luteitalea sp. TBR-22 TaxID=2802971 RepID=UPI001AF0582B|nr:PEP-CTERM sorting domain-containing protein [Luteitalea sp. TBR-22]BCS35618.1 hypothetical protein TBR22_A48520 [Luteitalea sp. TBR-22]